MALMWPTAVRVRDGVKADGVLEEICLFTDKPAKVIFDFFLTSQPESKPPSKNTMIWYTRQWTWRMFFCFFKKNRCFINQDLLVKNKKETPD